MSGLDTAAFWMVWNPQGHAPMYKHITLESAKDEAERLSRSNPGQQFVVLHALCTCSYNPCQWTMIDNDEIPF